MEDWQQRVYAEKAELDVKIAKLREFIGGATFDNLAGTDQAYLEMQLVAMRNYERALALRIKRIESVSDAEPG